jgi:hypothetical protein
MAGDEEQGSPRWRWLEGVVVPLMVALIGLVGVIGAAVLIRNGGEAQTGTEVRACMAQYQMSQAKQTVRTVKPMRADPDLITPEPVEVKDEVTVVKRCDWPPPAWAHPDGYSEIRVVATLGPLPGSSTDADYADIIKSSCTLLEVNYSTIAQGYQTGHRPTTYKPHTVVYWHGKKWPDGEPLPFIYERDELVVLRNERTRLDNVQCVK